MSTVCHVFPYLVPQPIDYTSTRGGVSVLTNKAETTVSSLIIQKAAVEDGGLYSCQAGQIEATSVKIHVLTGKRKVEDVFAIRGIRDKRVSCCVNTIGNKIGFSDAFSFLIGDNLRGLHTNTAAVAWPQPWQRHSKNLILLLYLVFIRLWWW